MKKIHKVYCCKTDADWHIPDDDAGIRIYFSEESVKRHLSCWEECGVVELKLDCSKPKIVIDENWELAMKNAKSSEQIAWEYVRKGPYKILKTIFSVLGDIRWAIKELTIYYYYKIIWMWYGPR
jgi:hypothetical protein